MAEEDEVVLRVARHARAPFEPTVREDAHGRDDAALELRAARETSIEKRLGVLRRVTEILGRLERKMRHELTELEGK